MKRALLITIVLLALLPDVVKAQWTFDVVSVEAYINDHKKQRSLLLARSTLEYSNQLLHEYSRKEVGEYKELNIDLDRYTRAFDVIDVMYQSLRTVLNAKNTYNTVSDRIADYKSMLEAFHEKVLKRGRIHDYPGFTIPVCFYDLLPATYIDILLPCIQHTELKYLPVVISFFRWE